jgi:lactate dehydrogenase-like 2-hydroxyacid dehydrogenase
VRLLLARQQISADLTWDGLAALLPGWELATCPPAGIAEHAEGADVATATDLGVWVARVAGDAGGNADSVAELAVLHLLALTRRLDESRTSPGRTG